MTANKQISKISILCHAYTKPLFPRATKSQLCAHPQTPNYMNNSHEKGQKAVKNIK